MKKILSLALLLLAFSFKSYSQTNIITWTLKDNVEKGYFKTTTVFNSTFSGMTNKEAAEKLCQQIRLNADVASCVIVSGSGSSYDIKLTMKEVHNKKYYLGMAKKLNIAYIEANGQKKTPDQWLETTKK